MDGHCTGTRSGSKKEINSRRSGPYIPTTKELAPKIKLWDQNHLQFQMVSKILNDGKASGPEEVYGKERDHLVKKTWRGSNWAKIWTETPVQACHTHTRLHWRLVWSTLAREEPLLEQRRGKVEPIAMATQLAAFFLPSRVTWQPALAFQCQIPEKHTALATAGSPARSVTETGGNYQMSGKIWESAFQKEDIFIPTSCSCQSVC